MFKRAGCKKFIIDIAEFVEPALEVICLIRTGKSPPILLSLQTNVVVKRSCVSYFGYNMVRKRGAISFEHQITSVVFQRDFIFIEDFQ